ncbi:Reverse transcriptase precursor, partial [Globisporangium splendens]
MRNQAAPFHWSASYRRKGGVAILRNPHSAVRDMTTFMAEHWAARWMAVTVVTCGEKVLQADVYAPQEQKARENLFSSLARQDIYETIGSGDYASFSRRNHNYQYTIPGDQIATSRLDRWYVAMDSDDWVRCVTQEIPDPLRPQRGLLTKSCPRKLVWLTRPRRVHPIPGHAADAATRMEEQLFDEVDAELTALLQNNTEHAQQATATAIWRDSLNERYKRSYLAVKKDCEHKMRNSHQKRLGRLNEEWRALLSCSLQAGTSQRADGRPTPSPVQSHRDVRNKIAECKRSWADAKAQRLRSSHAHVPHQSTKKFFRRIATKFSDNTIHSLGPGNVGASGSPKSLANAMADGWRAVMQQNQVGVEQIRQYLSKVSPPTGTLSLDSLSSPVSEDEIRAAIKRCRRGKAHGTFELSNDWYRNNVERLTPIFVRIMNLWFAFGEIPKSFKDANIHCLKKLKTAARPLDHRPIALLKTDYKIFTRTFATRLHPLLPNLLHALQAGFVPGRSIHTPNDTFLAICQRADRVPRLANSIGLLLDFAKSYDSLNRVFLVCVLQLYGFPKRFFDVVANLHDGSTCRFLVNGFLSNKIRVTCGIRQGCSLAPLLFIIALDVLYRVVETMPDVSGIPLVCGAASTEIRISRYADDTALYLADASDIPMLLTALREFGSVSGLQYRQPERMRIRVEITVGTGFRKPKRGSRKAPINYETCCSIAHPTLRHFGRTIQEHSNIMNAGNLLLWNRRDCNVACLSPACPASRVANSEHVFWECPEATALWQPTLNLWQGLGLDLGGHPVTATLSLQLPDALKMAWARLRDVAKDTRLIDEHHDLLFPMADVLWQYFCGATIANIWRYRNILIKYEEVSRANTSQFAILGFASA